MRTTALSARLLVITLAAVVSGATWTAAEARAQDPPAETVVPGTLVNTTWRLIEMDGRAPEPDLPPVTLAFGPARAEGSGGCNWYSAWLEFPAARQVAVSYLTATRRDCLHPRIMDREVRYLEALETLETYRLDGDRLFLAAGTTPGLAFRRE
ncbi:MAG TPA: META domain-containing protein [Gemmatimonadota bacterium]|nr:META domain-containing protein [Gemmatimonadota bacterium]